MDLQYVKSNVDVKFDFKSTWNILSEIDLMTEWTPPLSINIVTCFLNENFCKKRISVTELDKNTNRW